MRRPLPVIVAVAALGFTLGFLTPSAAFAEGKGWWFKFLFTPQGGYNSACLTCGWHSGACDEPYPWGPALDFGALCSDGGQQVYFRNFGFKPSGSQEWVVSGSAVTSRSIAIPLSA